MPFISIYLLLWQLVFSCWDTLACSGQMCPQLPWISKHHFFETMFLEHLLWAKGCAHCGEDSGGRADDAKQAPNGTLGGALRGASVQGCS